jgi:hypothetical protein
MARSLVVALALVAAVAGGCARSSWSASTTQPYPQLNDKDAPNHSERLQFALGDMDLPRTMELRQQAYFTVLSRDRLRFNVDLRHKWEEVADVTTWDVRLEDDQGHVYTPKAVEGQNKHVTRMWDQETRIAVKNEYGDVVETKDSGGRLRQTLESVDVFRGRGTFDFLARDLLHKKIKRLTLVMRRKDLEYRFSWNFSDDPATWRAFRERERKSAYLRDDPEDASLCPDLEQQRPTMGGCIIPPR